MKKQGKAKQTSKIQTKKVPNGKLNLQLRISASSSMTKFMQTVKFLISNEENVLCIKRRTKMNHLSFIRQLFLNCFSSNSFKWARACALLRCNVTWKKLIFCSDVDSVLRVRLASPFNSTMSFLTNLLSCSPATHVIVLVV